MTRPPSQDSIELAGDAAFITEAVTKTANDNGFSDDDMDLTAAQPGSSTELPGLANKREIIDMMLVWEDKMN